jgi:phage terminase large subunit-like protein
VLWWVAPTNQVSFLAWERFKLALGGTDRVTVNETHRRIVLPNRSQIWCKSAEAPDNLRGEGVDDLTLDEAAHIRNLDYVWQGVLRPMLIDGGGSMIALSTPNRRNTFHRWFVRGQDPAQPDWRAWNFPTTDNPYLPRAELERLEQEYPPGSELYRQEILGEFLESGGAVFRKVREAATAPRDPTYDPARRYVAGIDWGRARDFTCIVVLDADSNTMVALDRFNTVDYTLQRDRLEALCRKWHVETGLAETNAMGEPNLELLQREGLPLRGFTTTAQSKRPLIEGLAQALELGEIRIFDDPVLVGELEAYERTVSPVTGAPTYSAPEGHHDDTVVALALAYQCARGSRFFLGII